MRLLISLFTGVLLAATARADVTLIGFASLPGDASDLSGVTGTFADGTPQNRLGGLGSAIAYTGSDNSYILASDRGPHDGKADYVCRFHTVDIVVSPGKTPSVVMTLRSTTLLSDEQGRRYTGAQSAINSVRPGQSMRLDPEGVRVSPRGTLYIADEYGPHLMEFDRATGRKLRSIEVPDKFKPKMIGLNAEEEMPPRNNHGRQPNRGIEGLAITPNGQKLVGALQSPLIQDNAFDAEHKRVGHNCRLIEFDLTAKRTREFLYPLDHADNGLCEILAINDHEFLVLERDGHTGTAAKYKKIIAIDTTSATDVSEIAALPGHGAPRHVKPVTKKPMIDLLDPKFHLAGESLPQKFEGLAFGPDLPDGRRLLIVTVDNDFVVTAPTFVYAFAIDRKDLPRFEPQRIVGDKAEAALTTR